MASLEDENRWQRLVEKCFRRETGDSVPLPDPEQDLIEIGALDSMGWVSFLRALESASGASDLGSLLTEKTPSLNSIFHALRNAQLKKSSSGADFTQTAQTATRAGVFFVSSSSTPGSRIVPSEEVDRAFGMVPGKLRLRAGIESLAYAAE